MLDILDKKILQELEKQTKQLSIIVLNAYKKEKLLQVSSILQIKSF